MGPKTRTKENGLGAGNTKTAIGSSILEPNPHKIARRGATLHPVPREDSTIAANDLLVVVARRLQRRYGLAWATAQLNACLAGLGGAHE